MLFCGSHFFRLSLRFVVGQVSGLIVDLGECQSKLTSLKSIPFRRVVLVPDVILHYVVLVANSLVVRCPWIVVLVPLLQLFWELFIGHLNFRLVKLLQC